MCTACTGEIEAALTMVQRCIHYDGSSVEAHLLMAQIYLHQNNTKLCSSALEQALSSNFEVNSINDIPYWSGNFWQHLFFVCWIFVRLIAPTLAMGKSFSIATISQSIYGVHHCGYWLCLGVSPGMVRAMRWQRLFSLFWPVILCCWTLRSTKPLHCIYSTYTYFPAYSAVLWY